MLSRLVAAALLALTPVAAFGASFSGTITNTNPPAAVGGRCAPALTVSIGPGLGVASGTSNFGSFVPTDSHCIVPPLPTSYFSGLFSFDFANGDLLTGTYSGSLSLTDTLGTFANLQDFIITGGTGQFSDATGSFTGVGNVVFSRNAPPASFETFAGTFNIGAVPEPMTWMLMIVGFGAVGLRLRKSPFKTVLA